MDFHVTPTALSVCETLADAFSEQPVDGDFVLPDYCPDMAAVLKCTLTPVVQSRQTSTDRLLADGTVQIQVLYLDEERRCPRRCEFSQPFSASFPLSAPPDGALIRLCARTDYVNCRAVSPRRLDVHGAFTLKLRVTAAREQPALSAVEGEGVYTRRTLLHSTVPAAAAEKPFTLSEVLEPEGARPAEMMLRCAVTPLVTECKVLMNKAILKGTLLVQALYVTNAGTGETETAQGEIPFSQILDMEGLTEEWLCDTDVTVLSQEVQMAAAPGGESGRLEVNVKLLAALYGWRDVRAEVVCDAYSAHCPLVCESVPVNTACLTEVRRDERTVRQSFELPSETVQDVLDVWCEVSGAGMSGEENALTLDGRLLWCLLTRDNNGTVSYYERAESFSLPYEDGGRDDAPDVRVKSAAASSGGAGRLELRADLAVARRCVRHEACTVLGAVTADEGAPYPPDRAGLKICYARAGESLWEIARRCRTSVEAVMEENHLTGETLSADTMLLIPLCG